MTSRNALGCSRSKRQAECVMAVLCVFEIAGMTEEMYRQAIGQVRDREKASPGFMAHAATVTSEGTRITEIWESQEHVNHFLESVIMPMAQQAGLPPIQSEFLETSDAFTS